MKKIILSLLISSSSLLINADGWGQQVGNLYFYNDKSGSYMVQNVGCLDFVSGTTGYSGFGQRVGNLYFYND